MMMTQTRRQNITSEKGSAFFYVLLGVILFGTLAFTVTRGMRSQSTTALTRQQSDLVATDIINHAQKISHGINRILQQGYSEIEISFEDEQNSYADQNTNCTENSCLVFHPEGGNVTWQSPAEGVTDLSWNYTKNHKIPEYGGTGHAGIVLHLPGLSQSLCQAINNKLGHEYDYVPEYTSSIMYTTPFNGEFANGATIYCDGDECEGQVAMCVHFSSGYNITGTNYGPQYTFYQGIYVVPDQ